MNDQQIWQTIALDLKRGANYLYLGKNKQAEYYLKEAEDLYNKQENKIERIKNFVKFTGNPEEILLGSSLISARII